MLRKTDYDIPTVNKTKPTSKNKIKKNDIRHSQPSKAKIAGAIKLADEVLKELLTLLSIYDLKITVIYKKLLVVDNMFDWADSYPFTDQLIPTTLRLSAAFCNCTNDFFRKAIIKHELIHFLQAKFDLQKVRQEVRNGDYHGQTFLELQSFQINQYLE